MGHVGKSPKHQETLRNPKDYLRIEKKGALMGVRVVARAIPTRSAWILNSLKPKTSKPQTPENPNT